jgi:hypothetical protein
MGVSTLMGVSMPMGVSILMGVSTFMGVSTLICVSNDECNLSLSQEVVWGIDSLFSDLLNPDDPLNVEAAEQYRRDQEGFKRKVKHYIQQERYR